MNMKKTLFLAVAAALALSAFPKPKGYSDMKPKEIDKADDQKWGDGYILSGPALKAMNDTLQNVNDLTAMLRECDREKAFLKPDKANKLNYSVLMKPLAVGEGVDPATVSDIESKRGLRRANAVIAMARKIERIRMGTFRKMVQCVLKTHLTERYAKWNRLVSTLEDKKPSEKLRTFDAAANEFCRLVNQLMRNDTAIDVTGPEVWQVVGMTVSGIDKYVDEDVCAPSPGFDGMLRTLDRYLAGMSNDERDAFAKAVAETKEAWMKDSEAMSELATYMDEHLQNVYPRDRQAFQDLSSALLDSFLAVELLFEKSEDLLKKADDESCEVGKLRRLKGFNNHGVYTLFIGHSIPSGGCPNYRARVKEIFSICKKNYMKAFESALRNHPDDPSPRRSWK